MQAPTHSRNTSQQTATRPAETRRGLALSQRPRAKSIITASTITAVSWDTRTNSHRGKLSRRRLSSSTWQAL